ncbi:MAG: OmpA family protein [Pseudomonadales bacterium]|nr:OmpA family protein [Pseudomonadales bacterium]
MMKINHKVMMKQACLSVLTAALLTGCVSSSKYSALQEENVQLVAANKSLASDADFLFEELLLQDEQIEQLHIEQDQLVEGFADLITAGMLKMEMLADGLHLTLNEAVLFASSETELSDSGKKVVADVAKELADFEYQIIVIGHTDNVAVGPKLMERFPSNWEVAGARASSVVRLLESEGVPSERLASASFGSTHPIASNDSDEDRAQNRRIEIRLRPVIR